MPKDNILKFKTHRKQMFQETDKIYLQLNDVEYRFRVEQATGRLYLSKSNEEGEDSIAVFPRSSNVIRIK